MSKVLLNEEVLVDDWLSDSAGALQEAEAYVPRPGVEKSPVLFSLDGPVMDYINPTRNGRKYEESTCELIANSQYMKEITQTCNFLGEPDHPMRYEGRLDVHYDYVSHGIRNFRKVPSEGKYYATFDILDTTKGRNLKVLHDYGVQFGVSSRGTGATMTRNGEIVVDPKSYRFITFDIVHMPGNKSARLPNANSVKNASPFMTERISLEDHVKMLVDNHDYNGMRDIKPVLEYLDDESSFNLLETINQQLSAPVVPDTAAEELVNAYGRIKDLTEKLASLEVEINTKDSTISNLQNSYSELLEKSQVIKESKEELLQDSINLRELVKSKIGAIELLESKLYEAEENYNQIYNQYIHGDNKMLSERVELTTKLNESNSRLVELTEFYQKANSDLEAVSAQLNDTNTKYHILLERYIDTRCSQLGLVREDSMNESFLGYSVDEIDDMLCQNYIKKSHLNRRTAPPLVEQLMGKTLGAAKVMPSTIGEGEQLHELVDAETRELRNSIKYLAGHQKLK